MTSWPVSAAAPTVGAVDSPDASGRLSSHGPRVGDAAIKPDLTAPGVGIVAALAAGTAGVPVDGVCTAMDGTSMRHSNSMRSSVEVRVTHA